MNIRTKLFIFIPILVILINLVSFFVFQSGKKVQESYNVMIDRVFLYKQISMETQENLRLLSGYIANQDTNSYSSFLRHKGKLQALQASLEKQNRGGNEELILENYSHLISSFLELETATTKKLLEQDFAGYVEQYKEVEKIASFIREDSQNLVDLELSNYQPIFKKIMANTRSMNQLGGILFILTTALSIVFAIWLSRSIVIPIQRLVYIAKQIGKGNLDIAVPVFQAKDEFSILGNMFHEMLENLRTLMGKNMEILEKERLVKELELKALQSQINPHFLFNTLNVISKLAYIEGAEQTSDLTVSTSNLLRYNLRKLDEPVTLRDEIKHAEEYFAIQKARFRDRVQFRLDINESCLEQAIPCLTLQPLLENAFVHGIEGMEAGAIIELSVKEIDNFVFVSIFDNGAGMTKETKEALLTASTVFPTKRRSTGLGTTNVFKRLRLFYEKEEIVDIISKQDEGTSIILKLPIKQGGQGKVCINY
ncbi:sensor histidine kinase [Bacillus sp. OTU530]|uniref:sensor histidine kinase n=1 Tax=Bacillus sp. OTU530 TaxID=3043862 RepID=UPI00313B47C1